MRMEGRARTARHAFGMGMSRVTPWLAAGVLFAGASPRLPAQQYDHGDPTPDEQLVLELINRARANPDAEGARLGLDLREGLHPQEASGLGPRPPLAFHADLIAAARAHARDMHARHFFDHVNPDGLGPGERARRAGYAWTRVGENIAAGSSPALHTAAYLQDLLMIDAGIDGRGHRRNLLDLSASTPPPPVFREIGIAYFASPEPNRQGFRAFLTEDFGRRADAPPLLVGVVYDDLDGDGFYDPGEGLEGIRIAHDRGAAFAVTSTSGGYACPVPAEGVVAVRPLGEGSAWAPTVVRKARLTGQNVKLDFLRSDAVDTDADGMPDAWEGRHGLDPAAADAPRDADGDGFANLEEFQFGTSPRDPASFPGAPPSVPPTGSPPSGDDETSGRCGLLGPEALLALLGAARRRRRRS